MGQVSSLTSRGFGASLLQQDAFVGGDRLTLSLRKPLRVVGGWAELAETRVDSEGYPITQTRRVGLRPDGNETDVSLGYAGVVRGDINLGAGLDYRADAENIRGLTDASVRMAASWRF